MVWPKYDVKDLELFDVIFPVSLKCSVRRLLALAMPSFRLLALMDISQDGAHCFGLEIHEQLELEWGGVQLRLQMRPNGARYVGQKLSGTGNNAHQLVGQGDKLRGYCYCYRCICDVQGD